MELEIGKFYWLKSLYDGEITIGQYRKDWGWPSFSIIGSDEICRVQEFKVLEKIDDYEPNQLQRPEDSQ